LITNEQNNIGFFIFYTHYNHTIVYVYKHNNKWKLVHKMTYAHVDSFKIYD
jgi:hypothetical protein